ncbi:hypothetical protein ACS0TY_017561 [Phlomoides rotata]
MKIKIRRTSAEIVASIDDLLSVILVRFPLKSLVCFKLVSKHWHFLITNPSWSLLRNPSPNPAVGLFLHHSFPYTRPELKFEYLSFSINKHYSPNPKLNFTADPAGIGIVQSCIGLLLCCSYLIFRDKRYYIYSPTTKRFLQLPKLEETILAMQVSVVALVRFVGKGIDTRFWLDKWVDGTSLKDRFPRLFQIDNNSSCSVADRYKIEAGNALRTGNNMDAWSWNRNSKGYYTVKSAYVTISETQPEDNSTGSKLGVVWNKAVPTKIAAFSWKALQDRIPTILNLRKRDGSVPTGVFLREDIPDLLLVSFRSDGSLHLNLDDDNDMPKRFRLPRIQNGHDSRFDYYLGESCDHLHYMEFHEVKIQFDVYEMKRDYSEWFVKFRVDLSSVVVSYPAMYMDEFDPTMWYPDGFSICSLVRGVKEED